MAGRLAEACAFAAAASAELVASLGPFVVLDRLCGQAGTVLPWHLWVRSLASGLAERALLFNNTLCKPLSFAATFCAITTVTCAKSCSLPAWPVMAIRWTARWKAWKAQHAFAQHGLMQFLGAQMEDFIRKYLSIVQWVGLGVLITQVRHHEIPMYSKSTARSRPIVLQNIIVSGSP